MEITEFINKLEVEEESLTEEQKVILEKSFAVASNLEQEKEKIAKDLEFQKAEAKKAFEKRDALKTEIRELESKIAEGSQNADLKPLLEKTKSQLTELESSYNELKAQHETVQTTLTEIREQRRNELISKLPEGSKEWTFAESLPIESLEQLKDFVEIAVKKIATDDGTTGKFKIDPDKKFDDYTSPELEELYEKNKAHYVKLYREKYGINPE